MASSPPGKLHEESAIVERALQRLYGRMRMDKQSAANAAELVSYLLKTGVRNEDDLVEIARIANGKRYDPGNGCFL